MAKIDVIVEGNGYAYVDDDNPEPNQLVTLDGSPDAGETLDDILAWDSDGHSIALYAQLPQTFNWNAAWGAMTIKVVFTGSTPPTPPTPTHRKKRMPIWMYPSLRG